MNDQERERISEQAFFKALRIYGYIFPETEEELENFEKSVLKVKIEIPSKLENPLDLLKMGRIETISEFRDFFDDQIEENLAQAAREGSDIPEDVWKQMEKDREKSEGENEEKNTE